MVALLWDSRRLARSFLIMTISEKSTPFGSTLVYVLLVIEPYCNAYLISLPTMQAWFLLSLRNRPRAMYSELDFGFD